MTTHGLAVFDDTIHTTNVWLKDLMERLSFADRNDAYRALRVTLHALRDRLPVNLAAGLAAQMPMLVRGFYYEGWRPAATPSDDRTEEDFSAHIAQALERTQTDLDAGEIARAVFALLNERISAGEIDNVKKSLPKDIREMWPDGAA